MPDQLSSTSRRHFLRTMGRLVITLPLVPGCMPGEQGIVPERADTVLEKLPGSMRGAPRVGDWLEVLEDGRVRIFSGKVELGQGIRNAIRQVAADELYLDLDMVEVILAETGRTPNEGYTAGSGSIRDSAMSVRYAAAAAREKLLELAAQRLEADPGALRLDNGFIIAPGNGGRLSFAGVLDGRQIEEEVPLNLKLKPKTAYQYVGKPVSRSDLGQMVRGAPLYIHDLRFEGMVHGRVLRPPNYRSELLAFDEAAFSREADGILKIVRNGRFLGLIAAEGYQADKAVRLLEKHTEWSRPAIFPAQDRLPEFIRERAAAPEIVHGEEAVIDPASAAATLKASYFKPYTMHAAMGPACAIGRYDGETLHVWSHSQGIYPMREALAAMLGMGTDRIHVVSAPGSGCYGHAAADDAAADAALLAMAWPGKPVRVRWSRADEHRWEPYGSAMLMDLEAGLDSDGNISFWRADIWTDSHSTRPNKDAGTLLAARCIDPPMPLSGRGYLGGGHRNGDPYYAIPQMQVRARYFDGPLRVSSLRSLGAFANVFAIESFMDELAEKAGQDPVAFRIRHLKDERAAAVLRKVQDMTAGVQAREGEGLGYAFCRYKNYDSYCAMAVLLHVDLPQRSIALRKVWTAVDVGEVINPDGIRNQVEGGIVQAAAWTLREAVQFSEREIISSDWASYPILRFGDAPDIEVAVIDRPEEAATGGGEVSTPPVGAAICNAIYRASGRRVYRLPVLPGGLE